MLHILKTQQLEIGGDENMQRRTVIHSRVGSSITGGHLVTHLARSYGILSLNFVQNLTRFKNFDLTTQFLGLIRVVVNLGGGMAYPRRMKKYHWSKPKRK